MRSTFALFTALFISTLTLMLGSGLLGSLLGLRMSAENFPAPLIGVVMSGFYVGLILGAFICPGIVHRAGHIRAFSAFAALSTASALFYPLVVSAPYWFFFRIITGLSMMGLYMVLESWLNDRTEPHMRGRVFSVYMAMTFLGLGFGQLFLNAGDVRESTLFLVVGIFLVLSLIPVALTRSISPQLPEVATMNFRHILRRAPMGLIGSFVTGMIASAFYSLAPVYVAQSGLQTQTVSYFMGITIVCGFLFQWPVGIISDRLDRQRVLGVLALLVCLAGGLIVLSAGHALTLLLLATSFYGSVAFTLYPIAVAHTNDRIEAHEIISASTALILCYGLGACVGPICASVVMAWIGPRGLYLFIASIAFLFGATVLAYKYFEKPKAEEPHPYIPVPRTSPIISTIHPYSESESSESDHADEKLAG